MMKYTFVIVDSAIVELKSSLQVFYHVLSSENRHNVQVFVAVHSHLLTDIVGEHGRSCTGTTVAKVAPTN